MSPIHFDRSSHSASQWFSSFWDPEHFRLIPAYSAVDSLSTPTPNKVSGPRSRLLQSGSNEASLYSHDFCSILSGPVQLTNMTMISRIEDWRSYGRHLIPQGPMESYEDSKDSQRSA